MAQPARTGDRKRRGDQEHDADLGKQPGLHAIPWRQLCVSRYTCISNSTFLCLRLGSRVESCAPDKAPFPIALAADDLLQALSTRQAVKAALVSYSGTKSGAAAHALLANYCDENSDLFSGEIPQKAAETFVAGLLELPVTMRVGIGGGGAGGTDGGDDARAAPTIVDPRAVCEVLFEWRKAVGEAWSERLARVPEDLLELRREHLSRSLASVDSA